jgi:hypothetical protein
MLTDELFLMDIGDSFLFWNEINRKRAWWKRRQSLKNFNGDKKMEERLLVNLKNIIK